MSLDGTLFVDDDGQPWMVFCHEWVQIKDGAICAMKLSKDLKSLPESPWNCSRSTLAPWSVMVESKSNNVRVG